MGYWNRRLTVRTIEGEHTPEEVWEVRELFYDDDDNVLAWTQEAMSPYGETRAEIVAEIERWPEIVSHPAFDLDKREWREAE